MPKLFLFSIIFLFNCLIPKDLSALDISISQAAFHTGDKNYLEVYIYVVGSTASFDTLDNMKLQASVDFIITIEQEGNIVSFDKFTLNSPESDDISDFLALKRFALKNGNYEIKVEAKDLGLKENTFNYNNKFQISFNLNSTHLSDIQLLSSVEKSSVENDFVKSGFNLEPAPFHFYNSTLSTLPFYFEVYNPSEDNFKASYVRYAIYKKDGSIPEKMLTEKFKKLSNSTIQPIILQLPIQELVSGNYQLIVEIRNREKNLIDAKSVFFQRSNPLHDYKIIEEVVRDGFIASFATDLNEQDVEYTLKVIKPLCFGIQSKMLEELFHSGSLKEKQYFIYQFFIEKMPSQPAYAHKTLLEVAKAVDKTYRSQVGYGFETDRGMIFMKYGKPSEIVESEDEPSAPPYEIWFYDRLEESRQYNIKFIFYNPSLAHNDFVLLHSNCRGERNNPRWEVELYDNAPGEQVGGNSEATNMEDNYRRNARKIWNEL